MVDRLAERGRLDAVAAALTPALVPPAERGRLGAVVADMVRSVGADGLRAQLAAQRSRGDRRGDLARIATPALFIAGADDAACPPDRVAELADLVPGARFELLPGAGHICTLTCPSLVAGHLRVWLEQCAG